MQQLHATSPTVDAEFSEGSDGHRIEWDRVEILGAENFLFYFILKFYFINKK